MCLCYGWCLLAKRSVDKQREIVKFKKCDSPPISLCAYSPFLKIGDMQGMWQVSSAKVVKNVQIVCSLIEALVGEFGENFRVKF
jgi:hypothetical protein